MDVKLAVLVLIAIGLTHEGDGLNLDRHARRQDIGDIKDGLLGAIRKVSTPIRRDFRSERLKTKCNLCKIHDKCKRLGKCEECEEPCEQYQQSLQPTTPQSTNLQANKQSELVALSQRTSTSSEDGLSENEDRYFTLGSFPEGAVQSLLRKLLGIKEPEGRMVVMVQPNSPKKQNRQPIIIDTAHVFSLNEGKPRKIDVEMHDVGKINEDAGELVTKLNRNIDEALNAKPKNEEPRLSPEEVDRIIASTIDTSNLFMNSRSMAPEDENLTKLPGKTIDADGALLSSGNDLPFHQNPIKKRPGVIETNDNEEEVGCSKEEEDDNYRSANKQASSPNKHPDPYQAEEPPKKDDKNSDEDQGKPVENHLEEDKSPINRNADIDTVKKDDKSGNDDKGPPTNNDLENRELQNDEPEVLFIENSPVPKPVADNQYGITNPASLHDARSAESYNAPYMQQPIVQPESNYNYPQQVPQNGYDAPQAHQEVYGQPEVFEGPQANYQQYSSPLAQYEPPQTSYNAPQATYKTTAAPSYGYSFVPQSQNPTQYEPIVEPIDISANSMEIMPGNLVNDYESNNKYLVGSPEASLPLKGRTELKGRDSADGLREVGRGLMHAPKIQMEKTSIDNVISTPNKEEPEVTIQDKSEIPPEDASRSLSWQQRDSGDEDFNREDGRGTMHAPKVQPEKTTIEKVISTPSEKGRASPPERQETPDRPPGGTSRTSSWQQRDSENTEGRREDVIPTGYSPKAPKVQPKRTEIKHILTTPTDENPPQLAHNKKSEQPGILKPTITDEPPELNQQKSDETLLTDDQVKPIQETVGDAITKVDDNTRPADDSYTRKIGPPKIKNTKMSAIDKIITTPDGDTQNEVPPEDVVESSWKQRSGPWRTAEQEEVPPHNTHDQHPTETSPQPEIPEDVVGNAQLNDALRRIDMLRFAANTEERADSSDKSHPTIKPVIPMFHPMRLPPRGVGLVPEPNKSELEMNLRRPTPSMDGDKIASQQEEVPPHNTHDQHPTETSAQPEIPEDVVGNAQLDDTLRRIDMLRFAANAADRADSSHKSHPTIKPVIPMFHSMRLPPRGVGLVPEPNKNELEMNLRQPTLSMDDDKIVSEQEEVPPHNTHDQHPTETSEQPEIPDDVVGNAQLDDALKRISMLRFAANAAETADSSDKSHPTIKPVIPLFHPMRVPPRGVGLVPEPNKNELEMNLRQPTPSMDDDKILSEQEEVPPHNTHDEHPTETSAQPEIPEEVVGNAQLDDALKRIGMLRFAANTEERADSSDKSHPTIKPVIPMFHPMRLPPRGVGLVPEPNKSELEMNLRRPTPSMDGDKIVDAVSGIVDDATLSATQINQQLMDIVKDKISHPIKNKNLLSVIPDNKTSYPTRSPMKPTNLKQENPSIEENEEKEASLLAQAKEDIPDMNLRQSESTDKTENSEDEEVGCKKDKKGKKDYYMKMDSIPSYGGNDYGNDEYRSATDEEEPIPTLPPLTLLPGLQDAPLLPTLQDLFKPRSHHEPREPNRNHPHRHQPQDDHSSHHNKRPNNFDRQQPNSRHFARQFQQGENQIISSPFDMVNNGAYHHLGRIVPWNHNIRKRDLAEQIRQRNMFFNGDGIKLPLSLKEYKDGSLHLSIDVKSLCNCKHCNGEQSHDTTAIIQPIVGNSQKIDEVDLEIPAQNDEKVEFAPNNLKELLEMEETPQMQEESTELRKRSIFDNRVEKIRGDDGETIVVPIQKFNRNNLVNTDPMTEANIIEKERTMSPEKFNILKSFLNLMKNLVTNDIDIR